MVKPKTTMTQQIARAASIFHQQTTGHAPTTVSVALSQARLVITLHNALSPAEKAMMRTPDGTVQLHEFHRQRFHNSADSLRDEIGDISGVKVGEVAAKVETTTGDVPQAFTTGNVVQVFLLTRSIPTDIGRGTGDGLPS
jgi:uncharacterized protein YbcI